MAARRCPQTASQQASSEFKAGEKRARGQGAGSRTGPLSPQPTSAVRRIQLNWTVGCLRLKVSLAIWHNLQAPDSSVRPWSYTVFKRGSELIPRGDAELAVAAAEMVCNRVHGDEQGLRDLAVGAAFGGESGDAKLARGEGIRPSKTGAPRASAGRQRFGLCPFHKWHGATASSDLERLPQRFPGLDPVALPPERSSEVGQCSGEVQRRRRFLQLRDRRSQQIDRVIVAQHRKCAKGDTDRSRDAGAAGVGKVLLGQPPGLLSLIRSASAVASDTRQDRRSGFAARGIRTTSQMLEVLHAARHPTSCPPEASTDLSDRASTRRPSAPEAYSSITLYAASAGLVQKGSRREVRP